MHRDTIILAVIVGYLMVAPFIYIWLQQSLFRESFDDEMGTNLVGRLYFISALSFLGLYVLVSQCDKCLGS